MNKIPVVKYHKCGITDATKEQNEKVDVKVPQKEKPERILVPSEQPPSFVPSIRRRKFWPWGD